MSRSVHRSWSHWTIRATPLIQRDIAGSGIWTWLDTVVGASATVCAAWNCGRLGPSASIVVDRNRTHIVDNFTLRTKLKVSKRKVRSRQKVPCTNAGKRAYRSFGDLLKKSRLSAIGWLKTRTCSLFLYRILTYASRCGGKSWA